MIKRVRVKFDKFLHDTGKAILVRIDGKDVWLGRFMISNLVVNKKLGGHFEISTKRCVEKGISYDDCDAVLIIEKHIPEKIELKKVEIDESLTR